MRTWDVVILGTNTAGILAGALLTKRGFSVLLLEEKEKAGKVRGKYRPRRFSNLSEVFVRRTVIEGVYQLLDLAPDVGDFTRRRDFKCQIILPGHRVDISSDPNDLLREMKREFPRDFGFIETFYARLKEEDWIRRTMMAIGDEQPLRGRIGRWLGQVYHALSDRPLSRFMGSLRGDKTFARFIDVQIKSMSYLDADDSPFSLASHLMGILLEDEIFTDVTSPRGFMDKVKREMVRGGGRISAIESFKGIGIEKSPGEFRIHTGDSKAISSRVCIGNLPFTHLRELIPSAFSGRKWERRGELLWPKYFVLSLNLGIDVRGVPVGLGDCFVSLRDGVAPYENGNLLMGFMEPEGVGAPSGKRAITVNSFVPLAMGKTGRSEIKGVIENMVCHLLEVAPFLDRSIQFIDARPSVERYRRQRSNSDIVYGAASPFRVGRAILPAITPMEGLFIASRENFPYLGFEGEIISGIKAAQRVSQRFG
jgi:phytoene dehydrogenase-like protein